MRVLNPELDHLSGIYALVCRPTGERYVGQTRRSFLIRRRNHITKFRGGIASETLQSRWNQYGPDAFDFVVLEVLGNASQKVYDEREAFHMAQGAALNSRAPVTERRDVPAYRR